MKTTYGFGNYRYELVPGWGQVPQLGVASGVACDSEDRVYVAVRDRPYPEVLSGAILVFNRDGELVNSIGEGLLTTPHLIWISPDDEIYYADATDHTVRKFSLAGDLLMTLGGYKREAGITAIDEYKTTSAPGEPFNRPTRIVLSQTGDLYVSDGYGQSRVHRLTPRGEVIRSWGVRSPHNVTVDKHDRVLVLDRGNGRCQVFSAEGDYVTEWGGLRMPNDLVIDNDGVIHIAEGMPEGGVCLMTSEGELIGRWGDTEGTGCGSTLAATSTFACSTTERGCGNMPACEGKDSTRASIRKRHIGPRTTARVRR